jgi:hypothetical protein
MSNPSPLDAKGWNELGNVLCRRGLWDEAMPAYRKALEIQPDLIDAHANLGVAFIQSGQLEAGIECQYRAIGIKEDYVVPHNNLGSALMIAGRFEEAEKALNRAIELRPQLAEAHFARSLIWLMRGDFENGWAEYEWRLNGRSAFMQAAAKFDQPRWDGKDLNGRTILLHAEGGLGDSIQFVRYAPLVARRGGRVVVRCQPPLVELFRSIEGIEQIVTPEMPLPRFDVHCPLMSLPFAFSTRLDSIPWSGPYLRAEPVEAERWQSRMGEGFKVGLAWRGAVRNLLDRWRSIEWPEFSKISSVKGCRFFSLQKEKTSEALDPALVDWTDELTDFRATAALVANLGLVITVDTSIAHLAGAMGKPVWVLIPSSPDFRWMLGRQNSPWYPSMRLFRQKERGNWSPVIDSVRQALDDLSA